MTDRIIPEYRRQQKRRSTRKAIAVLLVGIPLVIMASIALAGWAYGDIYQCDDVNGCIAREQVPDGPPRVVIFRKGDVINTGAGWVVSTDDGWKRLRQKRGGSIPETLLEIRDAEITLQE